MIPTIEKINNTIVKHVKLGSPSPVLEYFHHLRIGFIVDNGLLSEYSTYFKESVIELEKLIYGQGKITVFKEENNTSGFISKNYCYDKDKYLKEYKSFEHLYKKDFINIESIQTEGLYQKYIYIVNINEEMIIYSKPKKINDLIFHNKNPENFPFHPMLASDSSLCVKLAGEISFCKEKRFILINNISGHYLPSDWRSRDIIKLIKTQPVFFQKPLKIVSFANDGICISGF